MPQTRRQQHTTRGGYQPRPTKRGKENLRVEETPPCDTPATPVRGALSGEESAAADGSDEETQSPDLLAADPRGRQGRPGSASHSNNEASNRGFSHS